VPRNPLIERRDVIRRKAHQNRLRIGAGPTARSLFFNISN
jgi:hypothetical protein